MVFDVECAQWELLATTTNSKKSTAKTASTAKVLIVGGKPVTQTEFKVPRFSICGSRARLLTDLFLTAAISKRVEGKLSRTLGPRSS